MSPVVINLRSSLSTATAADLKIPPPDASGFSPPPSVVFGSFIPCDMTDTMGLCLLDVCLEDIHDNSAVVHTCCCVFLMQEELHSVKQ